MTERKPQRNRRGFTLTEVLLALAILIILLALVMIPISRHQRNIRQSELDSKAETIYLVAQNRLSQLQASGRSDEYGKDRATALNNIPWDAEQDKYTTSTLYYVTSAAKSTDTSAAGSILPREQVEAELWDANWVIEYDPGSGSVYAVFYSEKPMQYSFDAFNPLRSRDRRVQEGATVGYYGGDSVQSEDTGKLTPKMEIINKERLLLKVTCDTPRDPLHFYVTVTDAQGHSTGRMELTGSEVNVSYRTYTVTMVLDDLTEGKRFSQQRRFRQLTPGSDLTLKVEVESDSRLVDSVTGKLTTNSLFAEVRDGGTTAVVTYARHLQNLDEGSGLPTAITRALQEQDIQFVNTGMDDGWDSCYPGRRFTPIYNENLAYYDSTVAVGTQSYHPVIYELPVDTDGDGGLFESFRGTLRNIRLCGAEISAGGNAGGLAGSLRGGTTIEGCQVYLSPTRDKLSSKNEQDIWISGATAGGLVGRCGYDLTVRNSFASTVLEGGRCAGGLVGIAYDYNSSMGNGSITNCAIAGYTVADNSRNKQHLGEAAIGGLVGVSSVNLNKCSAVVDLQINCTHVDTNGYMNAARYGNYVRVGGLAGGVRFAVTDCYTGGTITVGEETLKERVPVGSSNNVFADGSSAVRVKMNSGGVSGPDTYVYIGGMGGSGFSASFTNFVNRVDSSDGQPTFNNCYTYMEFPDMEGTITGISLMGSIADRAGASTNAKLYINNCYYLNSSKNSISFDDLPKYYGKGNSGSNSLSGLLRTEAARGKMLNGDLSYLRNYGWNGGSNTYSIKGLTGLTYEQMSQRTGANIVTQNNGTGTAQRYDSFAAALGSSFAWVTTEENGAEVHGKYSFPGSDEALQGQDFPFPTVLVQDNVFGRARLHYGWWPSSGLYWSKGLLTLDMITDYDAAGGESAVTLDLRFEGTAPGTELPTLSYTKDGIVTAELQPDGTGHYKVRIVGQAIGSTEIIATLGDYTARLAVDVTAKLSISVDQLSVEQYVGESTTLTLTARDGTGQVLTGVKWDVVSGSDRVVTLSPVSRDQQVTVTGKGEGEETLLVQAGVTVGQRTFTSELRLTATIHMQGVLGIAHVGDGDAVYRQGILNRDATDWDTPLGPAEGDVPDYEGLYLYSRGKAADFRYFTVTALTVLDSTGTSHDMLSTADEDYRVTVGDVVAAQQDGDFSYRPITIHGRQQETVTLQVTLTDSRTGRPYPLDIPYTLTAEDTQITATFVVGRLRLEKAVPFGQPAAGFLPTEEELVSALRPVVGWTPSPDLPLFQDTTFEPIYQDTEEPGLLRWRWSR